MIKTIIFDLGGVYFEDGSAGFADLVFEKFGVPKEKVWDVVRGDLGHRYRSGKITTEEFWIETKKRWNIDADTKMLSRMWIELYIPIEGTVRIVNGLKNAGYEVFFESDNIQERVDYLQSQYRFMDHFDGGVFSHLMGTRKPDPKMYEAVLAKTASTPDHCVFIDNKETNLAPARVLGMHAIHFRNPEQLEQELIALGVQWTSHESSMLH